MSDNDFCNRNNWKDVQTKTKIQPMHLTALDCMQKGFETDCASYCSPGGVHFDCSFDALLPCFIVSFIEHCVQVCSGSLVCSGSVVVTACDFESGRPGSNPEWGLIYYKASITAQGLPEPSSLWGSTLGIRAAEHKGCNWGMQIDWWLQPRAVFGHTFSGIIWHMSQE